MEKGLKTDKKIEASAESRSNKQEKVSVPEVKSQIKKLLEMLRKLGPSPKQPLQEHEKEQQAAQEDFPFKEF